MFINKRWNFKLLKKCLRKKKVYGMANALFLTTESVLNMDW